jgi:hypothetical protein
VKNPHYQPSEEPILLPAMRTLADTIRDTAPATDTGLEVGEHRRKGSEGQEAGNVKNAAYHVPTFLFYRDFMYLATFHPAFDPR